MRVAICSQCKKRTDGVVDKLIKGRCFSCRRPDKFYFSIMGNEPGRKALAFWQIKIMSWYAKKGIFIDGRKKQDWDLLMSQMKSNRKGDQR